MFGTQTEPHRRPTRRTTRRGRPSSASVIACLALFVALGGTAAAAVTLDRDSVGSPQIRDGSIRAADMSTGARTALRGGLKVTADDNPDHLAVPMCGGSELWACPNRLELSLARGTQVPATGRSWLIQARLHVAIVRLPLSEARSGVVNRCGLVDTSATAGPGAVLDEIQVGEAARASSESVALAAVVPRRLRDPSIALRCTSQAGDRVTASFIKITALTIGPVTGA
jgi:hypothetical protein